MSTELLYFPKKEFSPRFGDTFFTFNIKGHEIQGRDGACGGSFAVYNIEILRGKESWGVKHRFSDFDKLHQSLLAELPPDCLPDFPALPPKTCFRSIDEALLTTYLEALLKLISDKKLMYTRALSLRDFLELK